MVGENVNKNNYELALELYIGNDIPLTALK